MEPSAQECAFGAEVARRRATSGLTQQWVAHKIGLSRTKISEIEHGRFVPSRQALETLMTALDLDRDRTVRLWRAAVEARRQRRRSARLERHPEPAGWSALPPLPDEVWALLRAQQQVAKGLPYRLPGARPVSLATVHVRQELASGAEDHPREPRPEPVLDARGVLHVPVAPAVRLSVRPPARTVRDVLDEHDHLLVTGGPGRGKSTLSLRLAADVASAWGTPVEDGSVPLAEPVVPLRVTARTLAVLLDMPFAQTLAAALKAEYGALLPRAEVDAALLAERVAGCRWLLLVDGLDEVADLLLRDRLVTVLAARVSDPGGSPYRVILTTRPVDSAALVSLQSTARFELQPFDEAALRLFASQWFGEGGKEQAARFVRQIRAAYLDELVQEPLLATIAAIVFDQHPDRPLPDNQYELYEEYLAYLAGARATSVPAWLAPLRAGLLEHLGQVRLTIDVPLMAAACRWVADQPGDRPPGWQADLHECLSTLGPLVRRGEEAQFIHHSFAEHLAATADARALPAAFDPENTAFAALLHNACQGLRGRHAGSVLLHYTRLRPVQADRIVDWLHHGNPDQQLLAAELVAKHAPASDAVVDAFLATARGWAMATQYPARSILRQVGRAAHHPGLSPWLTDLMRDAAVPWTSRIDAATALASRLRGPSAGEAAAMLRTVTQDESLPISDRLAAAEALADCGPDERDAAEHGLSTLLADPSITSSRLRSAAVVLAGLSTRARTPAVAALSNALDDPVTPLEDQVDLAAGLAEIDVEFHQRCAEVLRTVAHSRGSTIYGRRQAVLGLATLGPRQSAEAVEILTTIAGDRTLQRFERADAAAALAEIGPQYRHMASRLLLAMLAEPGLDSNERHLCAAALGRLGAEFQPAAAAQLRTVIADHNAIANYIYWAIDSLVELGPEYRAQAVRAFQRLLDDPLVDGFEHAGALEQLAKFGDPHHGPAIDRLRAELGDRYASPNTRVAAAQALRRLGPQYHTEVAAALLEVAAACSDTQVIVECWDSLVSIGTRYQRPAVDAFLEVLQSSPTDMYVIWQAPATLARLGGAPQRRAATILRATLADRARSHRSRIAAAHGLVRLGRQHQQAAVDGFVTVLREAAAPGPILAEAFRFDELGPGSRAQLVAELLPLMTRTAAEPDVAGLIAQALVQLGAGDAPGVVAALQVAAAEQSCHVSDRQRAAMTLTQIAASYLPAALTALRNILTSTPDINNWERVLLEYARLGGDAVSVVRALLADHHSARARRVAAASALPKLDQNLAGEAAAELRDLAEDPYLDLEDLLEVVTRLAELEPSTHDAAIAMMRTLLEDDDQPVEPRVTAAYNLVKLDRAHWSAAVANLRRLVNAPFVTPIEQEQTLSGLLWLKALRPHETVRLAQAIANNPATPATTRQSLIWRLPPPQRLDLRQALLDDHAAPITTRIPEPDHGEEQPLAAETEAALREVLAACETSGIEQVKAAANLVVLSSDLAPEGVRVLQGISQDEGPAARRALAALARLTTTWRQRTIHLIEEAVADESRPERSRQDTANVLHEIGQPPSPAVTAFLRTIAADHRTSALRQVNALCHLLCLDGPEPLRIVRDNDQTPLIARCRAAQRLTAYTAHDRAAAAQLFNEIATDPNCRPALRWRAANDLAQLGPLGHQHAITALNAMTADATLPVMVRAHAARLLGELQPGRRPQILTTLRALAKTSNPLHRIQIQLAIGSLDTTEVPQTLRTMAHDHQLSPVARLRSAEALALLRRDHREAAASTARELMHDPTVPHHIRIHAARNLARWSVLCRTEARETLRTLSATWPDRRTHTS